MPYNYKAWFSALKVLLNAPAQGGKLASYLLDKIGLKKTKV